MPCSATRWRAVGECVMNYDPRSLSMDIHPTPVQMVGPWHNTEAAAMSQMLDYMEAAPTWTWRVAGGVGAPERTRSPRDAALTELADAWIAYAEKLRREWKSLYRDGFVSLAGFKAHIRCSISARRLARKLREGLRGGNVCAQGQGGGQ